MVAGEELLPQAVLRSIGDKLYEKVGGGAGAAAAAAPRKRGRARADALARARCGAHLTP
jgi:hypothetical protein